MSIPLDRLYHYIENTAQMVRQGSVLIYRFYPHGSKNPEHLGYLHPYNWERFATEHSIYCNDQEPLDYDFYYNSLKPYMNNPWSRLCDSIGLDPLLWSPQNLYHSPSKSYKKSIVLHSEQRSRDVARYRARGVVTAYYWSHAVIARDWFRYAEHVRPNKAVKQPFLAYSRAWAGTREYRLKFADLLVDYNLVPSCKTSVGWSDEGVYYRDHEFTNPTLRPKHCLEDYYSNNLTPSTYSADFDIDDYNSTDIEVVLETLFDDGRLHLTEKSLRPIALGQPFILASTHGSLDYLRRYGFKTFSDVWDEDYDTIEDPEQRLIAVVKLMKTISKWTAEERLVKMEQANYIAQYNSRRFFSEDFIIDVETELADNLDQAFKQADSKSNDHGDEWIKLWDSFAANEQIVKFLKSNTDTLYPTWDQVQRARNIILQRN